MYTHTTTYTHTRTLSSSSSLYDTTKIALSLSFSSLSPLSHPHTHVRFALSQSSSFSLPLFLRDFLSNAVSLFCSPTLSLSVFLSLTTSHNFKTRLQVTSTTTLQLAISEFLVLPLTPVLSLFLSLSSSLSPLTPPLRIRI